MTGPSSPPPTPAEYAGEYAACRVRTRSVIEDAGTEAAARRRVAACPAWNVHDLVSHMAGVAHDLVERRSPGADVQVWVDHQVAERVSRPITVVLDEWDEVGPAFERLIVKQPRAFAGLLLDIVAHEHDIRQTLHRPGGRHSPGVRAAMFTEAELLSRDLDGHSLPGVRVMANGDEWRCGSAEVGLELDLGDAPSATWELTRLLGSRRSFAQLATYPWQGDWQGFLPALAHMPLPEADFVE